MNNQTCCPICGQPLRRPGKIRRAWSAYSGWKEKRMTTYQSSTLTPWQPPSSASAGDPGRYLEAERRTPYRPQNAESDFIVPLLQALGTGVFVTIGAGWVAWLRSGFTWEMALGCGILAAGGFWILTVMSNRKLLWVVESVVNSDLDNDGSIGQPEAPARPVALEITHQNEQGAFQRMFRFELPAGVTEDDFKDFAAGVTFERRGLAESSWTGSGRPFSKPKYNELLATLDQAGLVRWRNPTAPAQGRELTPAGGRALRMYLQTARKHAPADDGGANYAFIKGVG